MSIKRKFSLVLIFILSLLILYISYSLLIDPHYEEKADEIVKDYNMTYGSLKDDVKKSIDLKEKCIDDEKSLCKVNIKINKDNLKEIKNIDFYYNQQIAENFIAVDDNKIIYPVSLKGDSYDISYGKITTKGIEIETIGSHVDELESLLLESIYNVYGNKKIGKEYKSIDKKLDEIEDSRKSLFFRFLF